MKEAKRLQNKRKKHEKEALMKILMLTDRMQAGGAETHIAQLILGLRELGVEVALLSGGGALADQLEKQGIKQYRVALPTHNFLRMLSLRRYVRRLTAKEKFTVLHAHARIPALLIRGCERFGAAGIVTAHAMFRNNALLSRICYWGQRTVAVSEDLRQYVCEVYGIAAERVHVIPNGIDCSRFRPAQDSIPSNAASRAPRILFASRLDADCSLGAELLCRLAPTLCMRYPGVSIEIAGGGSEYERILEMSKEVNRVLGRTAVSLTGWVEDMPALLREHDIFIGVSRAAMEACACGCAVILCGNEGYFGSLERSNFREAMLTNFCARGCVLPSESRLEDDLAKLLEDPALRVRCAAECGDLITTHFSAERMCRETLSLYHRAALSEKRFTVTVGGYFGCGNPGDDAILLGLLEALHTQAPDIRLTTLSGSPRRDRRRFGVECVNRQNPFAIFLALLHSDALLFGGGSLLQNITSNRSLVYYLWLIKIAKLLHRPVFFCAAGIGPLIGQKACIRVRNALNSCRYVSLRDADSMRLLRALGTEETHLHTGADPALLMPLPPTGRAGAILREYGVPAGRKFLCIVLRGGKNCENTHNIILAAVRMLCRRNDLFPLFLIFDPQKDKTSAHRFHATLGGRMIHLREPADAAAILSASEVLIGMRLHALILASAVGTPSVGIPADARDNKIAAFAKSVGADCISPDALGVALLVEHTEAALASKATIRPILSDSVADQRKKARKDLANIVEMIYNNRKNNDCEDLP